MDLPSLTSRASNGFNEAGAKSAGKLAARGPRQRPVRRFNEAGAKSAGKRGCVVAACRAVEELQ